MNFTMKSCSKILSVCALIVAIGLFASAPAFSQANASERSYRHPVPAAGGNTSTVDDGTLEKAARAYVKVRQITQKEMSTMNGTSRSEASNTQVQQQAESEKIAAVRAEGLEPQQYNQVLQMVSNDQELKTRFMAYVSKNS